MKVLHTSDWHLGRSLYGKTRYKEFSDFLDWLIETITSGDIGILLVAGDIFDTTTPGNRAQELYYNFLFNISKTCCRHIVITAGNHDSPSFLSAPKSLLKFLNVHVIGSLTSDIKDEVIQLYDKQNNLEAIICAVPYLRDKDIRTVELAESSDDKNRNLINAMLIHYKDVCDYALTLKKINTPIIAMGHLFATGGKTLDGDGVRELYVGSLAHIGAELFPSYLDYVALGHLHVPQKIGGLEHIRYSGSPIPMGFGEAAQQKIVLVVDFKSSERLINKINVPCFQPLKRITGNLEKIISGITELKDLHNDAWLEIEFTGTEIVPNIQELLEEAITGSKMEIRCIKNRRLVQRVMDIQDINETLDDLNTTDVFNRCLNVHNITADDKVLLSELYSQIITSIEEEDVNL
ncbi:MAG: exonuclease SbcCD subunit D C-terminal domain-containing protein [Spirochaetaceae bacterium]